MFPKALLILATQFQTGNLSSLPGGGRELFPWAGGRSSAVEIPWIRDIPAAVPSFGLFLVLCWWMSSPTASTLEFRMGFFRSAEPRLWLGCLIPGGNRALICSYSCSSQTQEAAPRLCKTPHCKLQALGFISQPWKYWMCLTINCCLAGLFWVLLGFFFLKAGPKFS